MDLLKNKIFRPKPGCYEGKLFAENLEDASVFGRNFYEFDKEPFFVVNVYIDDDYAEQLGVELTDQELGVGPTISVDRDQLNDFNKKMIFKVYNYVVKV